MNIQVVAASNGKALWTSWSLLGSMHDSRAARVWKIAERIKAVRLLGLGDKGYVGLSEVVFCSFKDSNSEHTKLPGPGERAFPSSRTGVSYAGCDVDRARPERSLELCLSFYCEK